MWNTNGFIVNKRKPCFCRLAFIIVCGIILVLSFSVAEAKANNGKPLEKVRLQLSWYHQFQFAGYYAAQLKGYYQEKGQIKATEESSNRKDKRNILDADEHRFQGLENNEWQMTSDE